MRVEDHCNARMSQNVEISLQGNSAWNGMQVLTAGAGLCRTCFMVVDQGDLHGRPDTDHTGRPRQGRFIIQQVVVVILKRLN